MTDLNALWSRGIADMAPYIPGEQPQGTGWIKLNTNENPYPPSPRAVEAMTEAARSRLQLYPDPKSLELRQAIAGHFRLPVESTFVGNGSDETLAMAFRAFFLREGKLLFPDLSYSFYPVFAGLWGISCEKIPLREDFSIDPSTYDRPAAGIIFPNPNAPTARELSLDGIRHIAAAHPDCTVFIDEAYVDFGAASAVPLIAEYPNIVIGQTFSKSRSLAGLRVGFVLAHPRLIEALERVRDLFNSYTVDRVAQAGAAAAIADEDHLRETSARIIATRGRFVTGLRRLGFDVPEPKANFVFAAHPEYSSMELLEKLRARHILVRAFKGPRLERHARISIGTDEEMDAVLKALEAL